VEGRDSRGGDSDGRICAVKAMTAEEEAVVTRSGSLCEEAPEEDV
jgi:hypothetical protein